MGISRTFVCLFVFSLIGTLEAQVSQVPAPTQSAPASTAPSTQASTYKLAVKVRRVVLDVVVTDAKGKPVEGLKQDDFKVMEDGATQPVHFFDVHGGTAANASQRALDLDLHLPANTFSNLALAPSEKPVTILLYDMLNTPQDAFPLAHKALVKFIKEQKGSTRIAIFVLTDRLHMLQGFTDDETRLMQAVDSKKTSGRVSQLIVADTGAADASILFAADTTTKASTQPAQGTAQSPVTDPSASETTGERSGGAATPVGAAAVLQMLTNAEDGNDDYNLQKRVRITVGAFTEVARFVSSLPGRKNLIWMSGSFPVEIWPGRKQATDNVRDFNIAFILDAQIRAAQEALKESRVAIYPLDVRGLQVDSQFTGRAIAPTSPLINMGSLGQVPMSFGVRLGSDHAYMDALADTTGGRAFYNTNGLEEAMDSAALNGSEYYTLTYAPTTSKDDGGERKIKVLLTNSSYKLTYRRRYLAQDAGHPSTVQPIALDVSMRHGAPNSSELFFEAKVSPVGNAMAASTDEVATIQTFLKTNAKDMRTKLANGTEKVQHYAIDFAIVGRQLEMPPAEGGYATDMRFGLAAYTPDSELLNGTEISVKNTLPAAQYQKIESEGYHASMQFVVPEGAVSLRLGVRDEIGKRIGTMEIPLPISAAKNAAAPN